MRDKWLERVEYVASETRDTDTEPNKLIMWNAPNQDLYIAICPASHRMGISMRFERSGGCSTRNPRLMKHLTACYDAIAENEDTTKDTILNEALEAMAEFVNRVDNKEVRSTYTYNKFKKILQKTSKYFDV
jgi:hypothetical protein